MWRFPVLSSIKPDCVSGKPLLSSSAMTLTLRLVTKLPRAIRGTWSQNAVGDTELACHRGMGVRIHRPQCRRIVWSLLVWWYPSDTVTGNDGVMPHVEGLLKDSAIAASSESELRT
eukprot:3940867-Rhodomonas_salina.1